MSLPDRTPSARAPGGRGACWRRYALVTALLWPTFSQACATCGCTLSSDAAMGYATGPGLRLSLEYDYIHQDELRSGTRRVHSVQPDEELERDTLNRYVTTGVSYSPTADWNLNVLVPYVIRSHSTYGDYDPDATPVVSSSRSSSLGDLKLIGSFQGILPTHNLGVQLGIKLPTGRYGDAVRFRDGPAAGEPLDASLQPGTGSTDLIVGAYYFQAVSQDFDVFVNTQFQSALVHHLDTPGNDFRPGNQMSVSLGTRYVGLSRLVPQIQANLLHKSRDTGALADLQNTAGTVAYLSPGLSGRLTGHLDAFAFVQLPVYRNLYGVQLFPRYTVSIGATYAF